MKTLDEIPLTKGEYDALRIADNVLKRQFPIKNITLFGSKARGDGDEHSDLDVLLISSRPLHWREEKSIIGTLFDIGIEHNVIFSPLFSDSEEWDSGLFQEFSLGKEIIKEGAIVA